LLMPERETLGATGEQARKWHDLLVGRRELKGLNQTEAAERAGVSQPLISQVERTPYTGMRLWDVLRILKVYGIEPNEAAEILGLYVPEEGGAVEEEDPVISMVCSELRQMPKDRREKAVDMFYTIVRGLNR
jgi:transcriptional regulator with XRE-family HTH domain